MLFTERQSMLSLLQNLQLLEGDEDIRMYFKIRMLQDGLQDKVEKSENWLFRESERSISDAKSVELSLATITSLLGTKVSRGHPHALSEPESELIPMTKPPPHESQFKSSALNSNRKDISSSSSLSLQVSSLSLLFEEDEAISERHQRMLRNCYLYQQVIELLKYDASTFSRKRMETDLQKSDFEDFSIHVKILRLAYRFLGRFVYKNV